MVRLSSSISSKLQMLLDIAIVEVSLYTCMLLRGVYTFDLYIYPIAISPVLIWMIYSNSGVYRRFSGEIDRALTIVWAWAKVVAILIILAFTTKISALFSRQIILSWFVLSALLQVFVHLLTDYLVRMSKQKAEMVTSVIVGNNQLSAHLAKHINANPWTAHKIVGVFSDDHCSDGVWHVQGLPKLGAIDDLRSMVEKYSIKRVYFVLSEYSCQKLRNLHMQLINLNVDIVWAPDIFGLHMVSPSVKEVAGIPLYYLSESPMVEGARLSKLLLDKVLASIALVIFSPLMLVTALAVKMSSKGNILFRQERHGLDGKTFHVLKFRSMKLHEEADHTVTQSIRNDPRHTKVGKFIRATSIDELPQLFNVLKGDMSLVGPRPHAKAHNKFYAEKIDAYMSRHRILPGMTGLAQVNGYRGEIDSIDKMLKRVEYDLAYINNWSVWLDIRIMFKTVYTLFSKNAY